MRVIIVFFTVFTKLTKSAVLFISRPCDNAILTEAETRTSNQNTACTKEQDEINKSYFNL